MFTNTPPPAGMSSVHNTTNAGQNLNTSAATFHPPKIVQPSSQFGGTNNNLATQQCGSKENFTPLVLIEVRNENGSWITAKCFLDIGSNSSLIRSNFVKKLGLRGNGPHNT